MSDKPIQEFRAAGVKASIWENDGQNGKFYTTSIVRSYRDEKGDWKETTVFMPDHLPKLELVIRKSYEFIQLGTKHRGPANDNSPPSGSESQAESVASSSASETFVQKAERRSGGRGK